jgi:hypothetical protein
VRIHGLRGLRHVRCLTGPCGPRQGRAPGSAAKITNLLSLQDVPVAVWIQLRGLINHRIGPERTRLCVDALLLFGYDPLAHHHQHKRPVDAGAQSRCGCRGFSVGLLNDTPTDVYD